MKKKIINYVYNVVCFHLMIISNLFFTITLLFNIWYDKKYNYKDCYYYDLRLLIEFLSKDFAYLETNESNFSIFNNRYYELHTFYYSLKNKNSLIFQIFCFFYSFIFEYYFVYGICNIFPYNLCPYIMEKIEQTEQKIQDKMQYYSKHNFNYQYLKNLENYKRYEGYYIVYSKQYYIDWFKFFFLESILNISYFLGYYLKLHKFKLIRGFENKIEAYFDNFF